MRLAHRVRRIERAAAPKRGCRVCGGRGPARRVVLWRPGRGEPEPPRPACPGCGLAPPCLKIAVLGSPAAEQG